MTHKDKDHSHHHHEHGEQCSHHHHDHQHGDDCDHHHEHGEHCSHHHHHHETEAVGRYEFSSAELTKFSQMPVEEITKQAHGFMDADEFGKAVPLLEVILEKTKGQDNFETKHELALLYSLIEEEEKSLPLWSDLLTMARKSKPDLLCEVLFHFGSASLDLGKDAEARPLFEEALKIAKTSNPEWTAAVEQELAMVERNAGHYDVAEKLLANALKDRRENGDGYDICLTLLHMGEVYEAQQKTKEAKAAFEEALNIAKKDEALSEEKKLLEEHVARLNTANLKGKLLNI